MLGLLACSEAYEFDSWALGCPGSGNILFQRRMSSSFVNNQRDPGEEIQSCSHSRKPNLSVTHFSLFSTWLGLLFFPPLLEPSYQGWVIFFFGDGVTIDIPTALPP